MSDSTEDAAHDELDELEAERVDYMLRRAAGLLLTDSKGPVSKGHSVTLSPVGRSAQARVLYQPLLLLLNAARACTSFRSRVLTRLESMARTASPKRRGAPGGVGCVDWDVTVRRRWQGTAEAATRRPDGDMLPGDRRLAALVVEEFLAQGRALVEHAAEMPSALATRVERIAEQMSSELSSMEEEWREYSRALGILRLQARASLEPYIDRYRHCLSERDGLDFEQYRRETEPLFAEARSTAYRVIELLEWRHRHTELRTGLGVGSRVALAQSRSRAGLYELWCFVEVANALLESGRTSLVQRSLLKMHEPEPLYRGEAGLEVYFDFFGNSSVGIGSQALLPRARVEWLVRSPEEFRKSVLLDTKYYSEWDSGENLKLLGYMSNFGVDRGVIVFREDLDPGGYRPGCVEDNFSLTRFGGDQQKLFCALTLRPDEASESSNRRRIDRLVEEVILPS